MENHSKTYRSFESLEVYRASKRFRRAMYRVANNLPDKEKYNLSGQIRRAALSLTNNIAEGHGRFYYLDNIRFVLISRGSLTELYDDLSVCEDEHYLDERQITNLRTVADDLMRLINGYIRYLRKQKTGIGLGL